MATVHVSVSPEELVLLDEVVKALGESRSGLVGRYIRDGLASDFELLNKIGTYHELKAAGRIPTAKQEPK